MKMARSVAPTLLAIVALAHLAAAQTPFCSRPLQCGDRAAFSRNLNEAYVPGGPVVYEAAPADTCSYGLPPQGVFVTACAADRDPVLFCSGPGKVEVHRQGNPSALAVIRMIAYCMYAPADDQPETDLHDFYNPYEKF